MIYAGAGHPPAMIARPGKEARLLESRSTVLGVLPDAVDAEPEQEILLEPGDRIILYTDGITDVFDAQRRMLGVSGLSACACAKPKAKRAGNSATNRHVMILRTALLPSNPCASVVDY